MKRLCLGATLAFSMLSAPALGAGNELGEIRLTSPLSNIPWRLALPRDESFVAVAARDGTVSVFDLVNQRRTRDFPFFSPIRNEEAEKQRPIAVSPGGELIAVGAPLERDKPGTGRIYFFRRADMTRIIFTIEGLPSRPTALQFASDRGNRRLRLAATLADKQAPRVWEVSEIRDLARDPARTVGAIEPHTLPEPIPGFFSDCGRDECHSWVAVFPPNPDQSGIGLVLGADSGLVVYGRDFGVLTYGFWKERPDLTSVSSVSFSPDGLHFAVGRLALAKDDASACRGVDVYDVKRLLADVAQGPRLTQSPTVLKAPDLADPKDATDWCDLGHVAWSGEFIFAVGRHIRAFDATKCQTFKAVLHEDYADEANAMVQWKFPEAKALRMICTGTNTAVDVQPFGQGGVVLTTQDPFVTVFDSEGEISHYPGRVRKPRNFEGPALDLRDRLYGDLSISADAGVVLVRPLKFPPGYVAFDLKPVGLHDPLLTAALKESPAGTDAMRALKNAMIQEISTRRGGVIELSEKAQQPESCFGVALNRPEPVSVIEILEKDAGQRLRLRSAEEVRDVEFLPPPQPGEPWQAVIGTSSRLLYADCEGRDLWHKQALQNLASPGVLIRDDAYQVRVSKDRRFVVAAHGNGTLRWYRMASGQLALSLFVHPDLDSWVAWTPEGHFDSSPNAANGLAGWLRSVSQERGAWSVNIEPLSNYERDWRRPEKVREAIFVSTETLPADKAPNHGKPIIAVEVTDRDAVATSDVRFRITVRNFGAGDPKSKLSLHVETLAPVSLDDARSFPEKDYWVVEGNFSLNPCLQKNNRSHRIWAELFGSEIRSRDHSFVYAGASSSAECPRRVWGIFVGISRYAPPTQALRYAHQDAERFFKFWNEQRFYHRHRLVLLSAPPDPNSSATLTITRDGVTGELPGRRSDSQTLKTLIRDEIYAMKQEPGGLGNSDVLVIYLAGHGVSHRERTAERWSFLASDGDVNNEATLLDAEWIRNELAGINKSSSVWLFVDACRDYATSYRGQGDAISQLLALTTTLNLAVYVGAAGGELSFEFPRTDLLSPPRPSTCEPSPPESEGGGAFTHALLRLLGSDDAKDPESGGIHPDDLSSRLRHDVSKICKKQKATYRLTPRPFGSLFGLP